MVGCQPISGHVVRTVCTNLTPIRGFSANWACWIGGGVRWWERSLCLSVQHSDQCMRRKTKLMNQSKWNSNESGVKASTICISAVLALLLSPFEWHTVYRPLPSAGLESYFLSLRCRTCVLFGWHFGPEKCDMRWLSSLLIIWCWFAVSGPLHRGVTQWGQIY